MQANLRKNGDISIVSISGALSIEHTQAFKKICESNFSNGKVLFNLENASFVGSTGIQHFIDAMKSIVTRNTNGLNVVCGKPEFYRIFSGLGVENLHFHNTETVAIVTLSDVNASTFSNSTSESQTN